MTICRFCQKEHPVPGQFTKGCSGPQLSHGGYSQLGVPALPTQEASLRLLADRVAEVEADLGGAAGLSSVLRSAIRDYVRLELIGDHLFQRLVEHGVVTAKGNARAALGAWLQVVDRVERARRQVGLSKRVTMRTPADAIAALVREDDA